LTHWVPPPPHTWLAAQARPHIPQLMLLTCVLTQSEPQRVVPIGQAVVQTPAAQLCPAAQALPHIPQLVVLVWVSTQAVPQKVWPGAQAIPQVPAMQV
jgi:hypothetical protein